MTERVLLDGGPMHGLRVIADGLRGFALTLESTAGHYKEVGRTENGLRLFRWRETSSNEEA